MKKFFGTDGIRSKGSFFLKNDFAYRVGRAIAKTFSIKEIVIGCDTRQSSIPIVNEISDGLRSLGVDVYFQEHATTPMISYYSKNKQLIGIMITASHNPFHDNGIKIINKGFKTTDEEELQIESYLEETYSRTDLKGSFIVTDQPMSLYLDFFKSLDLGSIKMNVAIDCAHGASYVVAQKIINTYLPNTTAYNVTPDGKNINEGVGSTHLNFLQSIIHHHEIGFALDGDADRCLFVDKSGKMIDGDMMMFIFATYMKKHGLLKSDHVVLTKMSNPGILKAFKNENIHYSLTDVGDKHVKREMDQFGYTLGGEASGHIILQHLMHSGDGLLMGLYILKILTEEQTTLEQYLSKISTYPFKMINIKNVDKNVLKSIDVQELTKEIEAIFNEDYLILIRPSGTEPLVRVTMSHKDETLLDQQINRMVDLIKQKGEIV
ncbi:MAG: hypothetical protein WC939_05055 [Acholeplasmataceae bacterium]